MNKYKINTKCIEAVNNNQSVPGRLTDGFRVEYVKTDGWRGYYKAVPTKKSKWEAVGSDWVTGNWDDAGDNAIDSVEAKLEAKAKSLAELDMEMIVVYLPTSNVFSTAYDVFTRPLTNN